MLVNVYLSTFSHMNVVTHCSKAGPLKIVKKIRKVVYKLVLLLHMYWVHEVFHNFPHKICSWWVEQSCYRSYGYPTWSYMKEPKHIYWDMMWNNFEAEKYHMFEFYVSMEWNEMLYGRWQRCGNTICTFSLKVWILNTVF